MATHKALNIAHQGKTKVSALLFVALMLYTPIGLHSEPKLSPSFTYKNNMELPDTWFNYKLNTMESLYKKELTKEKIEQLIPQNESSIGLYYAYLGMGKEPSEAALEVFKFISCLNLRLAGEDKGSFYLAVCKEE